MVQSLSTNKPVDFYCAIVFRLSAPEGKGNVEQLHLNLPFKSGGQLKLSISAIQQTKGMVGNGWFWLVLVGFGWFLIFFYQYDQ